VLKSTGSRCGSDIGRVLEHIAWHDGTPPHLPDATMARGITYCANYRDDWRRSRYPPCYICRTGGGKAAALALSAVVLIRVFCSSLPRGKADRRNRGEHQSQAKDVEVEPALSEIHGGRLLDVSTAAS